MRSQVFSLLVDNNPGVLSRIAGLFSRRGYSIDSITAGATTDTRFTRITVVASGDELILSQIEKQVRKLEDVVDIKVLKDCIRIIAKEFMLNPYYVDQMQNISSQFIDNLYDKIVDEDVLSRDLNEIKNYLLRRYSFITDIIQEKYDLKQENMNLKEKYEELENKYKTMERNFYDAFS